jgi:alkyl sulfatase BDS1-like metallo-beta-lactamase superfamily hydrolase
LRNSRPQFIRSREVAIPQAWILLLVAELLENVRQQVFGGLILRFSLHQLVHDFLREQVLTPDNGEKFIVELENATLTNIKGFQAQKPDLTLTINRSDLEQTMMGAKTLEAQIADGTAKVDGDAVILKQIASTMVDFDPRFEIMPGTKARRPEVAHADPYEAVPRQTIAE